jgi:hypothetical protein|tara:strand:+ start:11150 stop:13888 length:2739 start_codon:yes stop_codon:yes gene_type:complete
MIKMKNYYLILTVLLGWNCLIQAQTIPLPEHPNPIKFRNQWINLNGKWNFTFDSLNQGIKDHWQNEGLFEKQIMVPFPWGSPLSEITDDADIGWYQRKIKIPSHWKGQRVFLIIGASDWETHVWIDDQLLGIHQGGYVPFEFEIENPNYQSEQWLTIRVDDTRRAHTLYGKQGYGNARGIWQTVYLEARGVAFLNNLHITPDIDRSMVKIAAFLPQAQKKSDTVKITLFDDQTKINGFLTFFQDQQTATTEMLIPNPTLWTLENPHLYQIQAIMGDDTLHSYFGMRKISVVNLPDTDIPYIALNNEPIYLQMALDQSYHPTGFYTFPSEQFIIDEIKRSKSIGLNGIRTHIKMELPRKLYWADKLGLLIMEDLPNSWGAPEEKMQLEATYTLREMIKRDFNHPAIFSWIIMNETWGLTTQTSNGDEYLPQTKKWLESLYGLGKSLDPTRLIEDNSICCGRGHTVTDINSWHVYLPGYEWEHFLSTVSDNSYEGATFHYESGYQQKSEPNINSESGNVWGYKGSTGDVDWSWDYHRMINSFRKFPKIGGWLYTEHHDVINEWNGYWRFDRTPKYTGVEDLVAGMSLNDFHSPFYISTGQEICFEGEAGAQVTIPLFLSVMSGREITQGLMLEYELSGMDQYGNDHLSIEKGTQYITYQPWMQKTLDSLRINIPNFNGISTLSFYLKTTTGEILHRNFVSIIGHNASEKKGVALIEKKAAAFSDAHWSIKNWEVLDGKKVNGSGDGYFEYEFDASALSLKKVKSAYFIVEVSAKELFVKDQEHYDAQQDFMKGSVVAPSSNPNAYPMTDDTKFISDLNVYVDKQLVLKKTLPDDPADHRGILSWNAQKKDGTLHEAGSYGYLIKIQLTSDQLNKLLETQKLTVRLSSTNGGGLAIYGKDFGRYPFGPSLIFNDH